MGVNPPVSVRRGSVLAVLLGSQAEDDFMEDVWERHWAKWRLSDGVRWLIGAADVGQLLRIERPAGGKSPTLGRMYNGSYQHLELGGLSDSAAADALFSRWQEGFTLIVPELHRTWTPAALFNESLRRETTFRTELNLYYTPPGAITFPRHYDTHDVFIVQLFGVKQWRIYPSPEFLPYPEEEFALSRWGLNDFDEVPTSTFPLLPDDVLYMPRGTIHAAQSEALPSLHLSIGLYPTIWRELLSGDPYIPDLDESLLRRGVPPAFVLDPRPSNAPPPLRPAILKMQQEGSVNLASRLPEPAD